jgi:UrcA family protein
MKSFAISVITALGLITGAAAYADSLDVPKITVRYSDLDLNTPQGDAVLYQRLQDATREVCKQYDPRQVSFPFLLTTKRNYQRCSQNALSAAVAGVHQPTFAAYVAQRAAPNTLAANAHP